MLLLSAARPDSYLFSCTSYFRKFFFAPNWNTSSLQVCDSTTRHLSEPHCRPDLKLLSLLFLDSFMLMMLTSIYILVQRPGFPPCVACGDHAGHLWDSAGSVILRLTKRIDVGEGLCPLELVSHLTSTCEEEHWQLDSLNSSGSSGASHH